MTLIQIPFHDLRKIAAEGHRTRDAHLMESFGNDDAVNKLLIIDRPTTMLEVLLKKKSKSIENQKVLLKQNGLELLQLSDHIFAVTWMSKDVIGQILHKKTWFRKKYADKKFIEFIHHAMEFLEMKDAKLISNNIFACDLTGEIAVENKIFDAWDDFVKIGNYGSFRDFIINCYETYAKNTSKWTTNALKNKIVFEDNYKVKNIEVITNGVDEQRFHPGLKAEKPADLAEIQPPIYGFGGKITHLIDPILVKKLAEKNPDKNFVFVGQNLVPEILNLFINLPNIHFLGDKHYDEYINYLANFDVCLVPYVDDKKSSGANTIKVYEYLAMGKKVVGTKANGLEELQDFVYAAESTQEFSDFLDEKFLNKSEGFNASDHSWAGKAKAFISILEA